LKSSQANHPLLDTAGYLHTFEQMPEFLARVSLDELECKVTAALA
jgi:hypothetical protein